MTNGLNVKIKCHKIHKFCQTTNCGSLSACECIAHCACFIYATLYSFVIKIGLIWVWNRSINKDEEFRTAIWDACPHSTRKWLARPRAFYFYPYCPKNDLKFLGQTLVCVFGLLLLNLRALIESSLWFKPFLPSFPSFIGEKHTDELKFQFL